jgi:hypothetical protein
MTDEELRAMVRESIARHLAPDRAVPAREPGTVSRTHPSHALLPLLRGADGDGACLIEPAVGCNHCGYCLSYGH